MSSRKDTPELGTSATNTNQAAPATPQDENREDGGCPECRHISTACSSSCRHCFCQLCLWDWSLSPARCPRCGRPTRHPYPQHVALYHEVQDRVYDSKRRRRGSSEGLPRSCSRYLRYGEPWDRRRRRRSMRWPRDGRRHPRHSRDSDSPRRRWWRRQQRRAWRDAPDEGQTPRLEWAIPASSQGSRSHRGSRRSRSRREQSWSHHRRSRGRERSHSWDGWWSRAARRDQDTQTDSQARSARQRRWRSWNAGDRHTPRPQHDVPSERSETHQREDADSSRQWRTRRRRNRGRSHRRHQSSQGSARHDNSTNQRRWRSWNADDRHAPRPRDDTPSRRWRGRDSSRQQHPTRSRSWARSHRRGQNSHTASQGMVAHDNSTRQRRRWNGDQERAPRSQQDIPGSSGRSQHRRRDS